MIGAMKPAPAPCTDPGRHVDNADDLIRAVARTCDEKGLRLTPIRARVLRLLAEAGSAVKAYELLEMIRSAKGAGADAPATIYRALDFLLGHGFIHKLQSVNAFVACHHPGSSLHSVPFLICDHCHQAVELEDQSVVGALNERARRLGFVPHAQTLEVHGLCAHCVAGAGDAGTTAVASPANDR